MKTLRTFLACTFLSAILFAGCSKSNDTATLQTGTIRYTNLSSGSNRYTIMLDGADLGLLSPNKYYDKTPVVAGTHIVKAVQAEGYLLYPTVVEKTVIVQQGSVLDFQFP